MDAPDGVAAWMVGNQLYARVGLPVIKEHQFDWKIIAEGTEGFHTQAWVAHGNWHEVGVYNVEPGPTHWRWIDLDGSTYDCFDGSKVTLPWERLNGWYNRVKLYFCGHADQPTNILSVARGTWTSYYDKIIYRGGVEYTPDKSWSGTELGNGSVKVADGDKYIATSTLIAPNEDTSWKVYVNNKAVKPEMRGNELWVKVPLIRVMSSCPVDIEVVAPDNLITSKQQNTNPDATYVEADIDLDEDLDDIVDFDVWKTGYYSISVFPEPGAPPDSIYTLEVISDEGVLILAEDVKVTDIPEKPSIIRVTEIQITVPELVIAPTSFVFNAAFGGANLGNKILRIANPGSGIIPWSIDDDADWLFLSPTNGDIGEETDQVILSVDIDNLAVGTYDAIITLTGPQKSVTIPVTRNIISAGAQFIILKEGWSLISLPVNKCFYHGEPPTDQPECVKLISVNDFDSLADWFSSIITPGDAWQMVIGAHGAMNNPFSSTLYDLKYLSPCFGYWVRIRDGMGDAILSIEDSPFDPECPIDLNDGWVLVGYPLNVGYYDTDLPPVDVHVPAGITWKPVEPPVAKYVI